MGKKMFFMLSENKLEQILYYKIIINIIKHRQTRCHENYVLNILTLNRSNINIKHDIKKEEKNRSITL